MLLKIVIREFPCGPVVRTRYFHCHGLGSIPGQGTKILQAIQQGQKKKKNPSLLLIWKKCKLVRLYLKKKKKKNALQEATLNLSEEKVSQCLPLIHIEMAVLSLRGQQRRGESSLGSGF